MAATVTEDRRRTTPGLTPRDHALAVVFGVWMVIGLFLDGWAHDNNQPESFFTPWHGALYSGFVGAAAVAVWAVARNHEPSTSWLAAIPRGHGVTLAGLAAFSVGAVGDLVWHETLGIEVGVEALLSPTHLLLLVSGVTALSAPFRAAWTDPTVATSLRAFLPIVLSVALTIAVLGFFLAYLSPFVNDAAGTAFERRADTPHEHPATDPAELSQLLGVASILVSSVLIAVGIQIIARRWHPPVGTYTLLIGVVVTSFVGLGEFRQAPMIIAGLVAGAVGDVASRRTTWALPGAVVAVLWVAYFTIYEVTVGGGVRWTAELWTGVIVLSALLATIVGFVGRQAPGEAGQDSPHTV